MPETGEDYHLGMWLGPTVGLLLAGTVPSPRETPAVVPLVHDSWVSQLAFSFDGRWLASTEYLGVGPGREPVVYVWDVAGRRLLRRFTRANLPASQLAFTPDGARLVTVGEVNPYHPTKDKAIQVFDVSTGKLVFALGDVTTKHEAIALSPHGRLLAALADGSGDDDMAVDVFDMTTGKRKRRIARGRYDYADHLRFVTDDVLEGVSPGTIRIWRVEDGTSSEQRVGVAESSGNSEISDDGTTIVTHAASGTVLVEAKELSVIGPGALKVHTSHGRTGALLHRLPDQPKRDLHSVAFSTGARHVAIVTYLQALMRMHIEHKYPDDIEPEISIVEVESGRICQRFDRTRADLALPKKPNRDVRVVFSPDGSTLAFLGWDETIRLVPMVECPSP